ncbi:hypothetical protein EMIT0111MI5_10662 [Burkholderia sp. IT-111MI5]
MQREKAKVFRGFAVNLRASAPMRLLAFPNRRSSGYSLFYSHSGNSKLLNIGKTFAHYRLTGLFRRLYIIDASFAHEKSGTLGSAEPPGPAAITASRILARPDSFLAGNNQSPPGDSPPRPHALDCRIVPLSGPTR